MTFFRIGTGGVSGTYYPIGGLIADIISSPPGARPCDRGGSCGVPGLVGIAQSSNGAVANVDAISSGALESGFVQSDVAHWAYTGTGIYEGKPQGRESARHRQPLSREHPPGRAQGRRHQLGRGPRRQARVARRAGLRHAGRRQDHSRRLSASPRTICRPNTSSPAWRSPRCATTRWMPSSFVAGYPTGSVAELCATLGCELIPIDGPRGRRAARGVPVLRQGRDPGRHL